jgi:hypothetical protein
VQEKPFPASDGGFAEQVVERSEENLCRTGCFDETEVFGNGEKMPGRNGYIPAVTSPGDDAEHPVASVPTLYIGGLFHHKSGEIQSRDGGCSGGRWIKPSPLEDVGTVDGTGFHLYENFTRSQSGTGNRGAVETIPFPFLDRFPDDYGLHERGIHSMPPFSANE